MQDPPSSPEGGPGHRATRLRRPPPRVPVRVLVWTAATLVVVAVLALLWRGSDAAATSSTTAPAPTAPTGSPAEQMVRTWSVEPTGPASDRVVADGQVVLVQADGVQVLDPATGTQRWHYTRSGARLCGATAVDGAVVAVFSTGGRCDEAVALDVGTGVRRWYRTVGFADDVTLTSTPGIVLARSSTGLATIDPVGNSTRWRYHAPVGCWLTGADAGSAGVVALQVCAGGPVQVLRFDGVDGSRTWTRDLDASAARLVGAQGLVGVAVGDDLRILDPVTGTDLQTLALPPADAAARRAEPLLQDRVGDVVLAWARGVAFALDQQSGVVRWSAPATGLPAAGDGGKAAGDTVLVPGPEGFVTRQLSTGAELDESSASTAVPSGGGPRCWVAPSSSPPRSR